MGALSTHDASRGAPERADWIAPSIRIHLPIASRRTKTDVGISVAKPLVIVESRAKAKTIEGFLGRDGYVVMASIGHIRDLPHGAREVPKNITKPEVRRLGIDVDDHFAPVYVVPADKKHVVAELKAALKDASELYLATDEDREGEAISWHLLEVLKPNVPVKRMVFHEITSEAIARGDRQLARSRHEVGRGAGGPPRARPPRRLRGLERRVPPHRPRHVGRPRPERRDPPRRRPRTRPDGVPIRHVLGPRRRRSSASDTDFPASLASLEGKRLASGRDFDASTGALSAGADVTLLSEEDAVGLAARLDDQPFSVASVDARTVTERPRAPFITSTLQQEAARKLGYSAARTMHVAQGLYERGLITYMRTDSTSLVAIKRSTRRAGRSAACTATSTCPTSRGRTATR